MMQVGADVNAVGSNPLPGFRLISPVFQQQRGRVPELVGSSGMAITAPSATLSAILSFWVAGHQEDEEYVPTTRNFM